MLAQLVEHQPQTLGVDGSIPLHLARQGQLAGLLGRLKRMETLHHYIIVRRDIPVGVAMAMVAHVAFANGWFCRDSSEKEQLVLASRSGVQVPLPAPDIPPPSQEGVGATSAEDGSKPAGGARMPQPIVVVLGARNEQRLWRLWDRLARARVPFMEFQETEGLYKDQLMAIGLQPGNRDELLPLVEEFQLYQL